MKRRIILMRHAKSAWDTDAPTDHARPLNKRGRRDAPCVAEELVKLGWIPELVLSSDSERARETYAGMEDAFEGSPKVESLHELYLGKKKSVMRVLSKVPSKTRIVLLLGHNPGWEELLAWLCGEAEVLKTANAALLEGQGKTWSEATSQDHDWKLRNIIRPKEH